MGEHWRPGHIVSDSRTSDTATENPFDFEQNLIVCCFELTFSNIFFSTPKKMNLPCVCQKETVTQTESRRNKKKTLEHEAMILLTRKQQILKEILNMYTCLQLIFEQQNSVLTSCFAENLLNILNLAGNKQKLECGAILRKIR